MNKLYVLTSTTNTAANDIVGTICLVQRHIETNMARIVNAKTGKPIWMTSPVVSVEKLNNVSLKLTTKNSTYSFVEINK